MSNRVANELRRRFYLSLESGDNSILAPDIEAVAYAAVRILAFYCCYERSNGFDRELGGEIRGPRRL